MSFYARLALLRECVFFQFKNPMALCYLMAMEVCYQSITLNEFILKGILLFSWLLVCMSVLLHS